MESDRALAEVPPPPEVAAAVVLDTAKAELALVMRPSEMRARSAYWWHEAETLVVCDDGTPVTLLVPNAPRDLNVNHLCEALELCIYRHYERWLTDAQRAGHPVVREMQSLKRNDRGYLECANTWVLRHTTEAVPGPGDALRVVVWVRHHLALAALLALWKHRPSASVRVRGRQVMVTTVQSHVPWRFAQHGYVPPAGRLVPRSEPGLVIGRDGRPPDAYYPAPEDGEPAPAPTHLVPAPRTLAVWLASQGHWGMATSDGTVQAAQRAAAAKWSKKQTQQQAKWIKSKKRERGQADLGTLFEHAAKRAREASVKTQALAVTRRLSEEEPVDET